MAGLTFGYTQDNVLENVSLHIAPGEFVDVIGESGIGKTTLIRIIMSFMSNIQGSVTFYNEKGETQKANAATRNFIAYVPQGNTLFSGTVRENIRMGNLNATEQEVIRGLQRLTPRPTCLVITHRKSILQYCDREIKIANKTIIE